MGGYGAMRNGLKYHETFGAIISLSGALNIDKYHERNNDTDNFIERRDFCDYLKEKGIEATYETGEGGHEWDFWDRYIKKAIEWLPTEKTGLGISSGNVGL